MLSKASGRRPGADIAPRPLHCHSCQPHVPTPKPSHLMGSACGRRSRTGFSAAMAARILTMRAGQDRWPPAARGSSPPSTRLNWPAGPPAPCPGRNRPVPLPLLPPDDAPGLLPLVAPGRAPLPLPLRPLPGSAGLRCCGCCCFLARGGRLKNCPGSGCRREGRGKGAGWGRAEGRWAAASSEAIVAKCKLQFYRRSAAHAAWPGVVECSTATPSATASGAAPKLAKALLTTKPKPEREMEAKGRARAGVQLPAGALAASVTTQRAAAPAGCAALAGSPAGVVGGAAAAAAAAARKGQPEAAEGAGASAKRRRGTTPPGPWNRRSVAS